MQRYILVWLSLFAGATVALTGFGGPVAQPACKLYKVTAPILDVRKDAVKPGGYIDVLEGGNIACVTKEQKVGSRMWGYVAHKLQDDGANKPVNGWVGLRYMKLQPKAAAAAPEPKAPAPPAQTKTATAPPPPPVDDVLRFDRPVPFGPYPVRGKTLKELAKWQPLFSPIEGLDEKLWKKRCTSCHKWNRKRLCNQGSSYIKSAEYRLPRPRR